MAVQYVETRVLLFKEKRSSRDECDERYKNICAQENIQKKNELYMSLIHAHPLLPLEFPLSARRRHDAA